MSIEELLQLKIKKISKLLTISEDYNEDIVITQLNNCLFDKLKTNLKEGTFLEKSQLLKDLQRWSYELNLYLDNPFLIGKTIIGIINENKDQSYNFYRNILNISEEESVILKENQGIPSLIISDYKIKKYIIKNKYRKEEVIDLEEDWIEKCYDDIASNKKIKPVRGITDYERVMDMFFTDLFDGAIAKVTWELPNE